MGQVQQARSVFILGIKGTAMVNIAVILKKMGKYVTGSDTSETFITDEVLQREQIPVITSFASDAFPDDIDLVIYAAAHGGEDHPHVREAIARGIPIVHQAAAIGELMDTFDHSIAVCGCHGKTTTSALLAFALDRLGAKPSYMVGTSSFGTSSLGDSPHKAISMPGSAYQDNQFFVLEADEYAVHPPRDKTPKLLFYHPQYALCTNIDFDHPDVYDSLDDVKKTFKQFFGHIEARPDGHIIACYDDDSLHQVVSSLPRERYTTYGFDTNADICVTHYRVEEGVTHFTLRVDGVTHVFTIGLYGEHNVRNAAGVIALLHRLGWEHNDIKQAVAIFSGVKRRFEHRGTIGDIMLFDDYAHHPTEIEATIQAARLAFPQQRVGIIFQPHTYSRTQQLQHAFVHALAGADYACIAPIFASAREEVSNYTITSSSLERYAQSQGYTHIHGFDSNGILVAYLPMVVQKHDILFTMGAGDVYKMKDAIVTRIRE